MADPAANLDEIRALLSQLPGPDFAAGTAAAARQAQLTKPSGSLGRLEELARRTPAPAVHIGLLFGRALLARESDAEPFYEAAVAADPQWAFDHARAEMSYGAWLRRRRRITESRPHLRVARDTFEALGVRPWTDQARAEMRASGERDVEPAARPRPPLTPQELQIARLAASGLSNREIADRLFLSNRTVGAHMYRLFPKLGIVSRSDLGRALASVEPAPMREAIGS